jgi:hypothetical protein
MILDLETAACFMHPRRLLPPARHEVNDLGLNAADLASAASLSASKLPSVRPSFTRHQPAIFLLFRLHLLRNCPGTSGLPD